MTRLQKAVASRGVISYRYRPGPAPTAAYRQPCVFLGADAWLWMDRPDAVRLEGEDFDRWAEVDLSLLPDAMVIAGVDGGPDKRCQVHQP